MVLNCASENGTQGVPVIRRMGPGMTFVNAQVSEEVGQSFGNHGRAPVRMEGQLVAGNALFAATLGNQLLCQFGCYVVG
jgi:hypothetical protein